MKIKINCAECRGEFEKEKREVTRQNKNGKFKFYCCKICEGVGRSRTQKKHFAETKECLNCGEDFESSTHVQAKTCCSRKCAAAYSQSFCTEESKSKTSTKIKEKWANGGFDKLKTKETFTKVCEKCLDTFATKREKRRYCCLFCAASARNKSSGIVEYRNKCKFNFSLNDFPEEFDFSLIEIYGWYKASNRGDNLSGVSRDHMVSVKYGFENDIDPNIMSHPANCCLMCHNDNFKKKDKCSLTLEQLKDRINEWDKKYPKI